MTSDLFTHYSAILSPCGKYRYRLSRKWSVGPQVCWIMLNPSTADHEVDDPTVTRVVNFSRRWGNGGLVVVNLFAWRATDPKELLKCDDPEGPDNDQHIVEAVTGRRVMVAWGAGGTLLDQNKWVLKLIHENGIKPECLGVTKSGQPRHPLFLKVTEKPVPYGIARG